jgi:hypothetical protein
VHPNRRTTEQEKLTDEVVKVDDPLPLAELEMDLPGIAT